VSQRNYEQEGEEMITPERVEKRLLELSGEIDEAQNELNDLELSYYTKKAESEIGLASIRLSLSDVKMTVQARDDKALTAMGDTHIVINVLEAQVRAARGNVARVKMQIDIARSIGTSVRASYDSIN
jgi:hypothetical protein